MKRRDFSKTMLYSGLALPTVAFGSNSGTGEAVRESHYREPAKDLPIREFDVVVAGGGTAGVFAAAAAARTGARTALIEGKGYTGGVAVEGGTALHSFYNLWKPFGVEKRQVIKGLPQEFIDKLYAMGGCTGHGDQVVRENYDSVCTAIDTELYKLAALQFLRDAGVKLYLNSFVRGAVSENQRVQGAIVESRSGREFFKAGVFIDTTGYADLAAAAGAEYTEPNDYPVVNSMALGNVDIERYYRFLKENDALVQLAYGRRSGKEDQIIRLGGRTANYPEGFREEVEGLGVSTTTTTVHDNYLMFIKCNVRLEKSPTDRDTVTGAEIHLREVMYQYVEALKRYIPGLERAFITRTAPSLVIRRGRLVKCDYDISHEEVINATHFDDEIFNYGFHDSAPKYQVGKGETYGLPYRAICASGLDNLFVGGMIITSDHRAHMSTRNTVSCMAQGQAAGTAAALCAKKNLGIRDLPFPGLKDQLIRDGVYFEA